MGVNFKDQEAGDMDRPVAFGNYIKKGVFAAHYDCKCNAMKLSDRTPILARYTETATGGTHRASRDTNAELRSAK